MRRYVRRYFREIMSAVGFPPARVLILPHQVGGEWRIGLKVSRQFWATQEDVYAAFAESYRLFSDRARREGVSIRLAAPIDWRSLS